MAIEEKNTMLGSTNNILPRKKESNEAAISGRAVKDLIAVVLVVAALLVWFNRSGLPKEIFSSESERVEFLQSVGAPASVRIITLVTAWCPACKQLDQELASRGVSYVRLDIEQDQKASALYRRVATLTNSNSIPKVILNRDVVTSRRLFEHLSLSNAP